MKWFVKNKNQIFITILPDWFEWYITTTHNFWFFSINIAKHIQLLSSTKYSIWSPGLQIAFCGYTFFSWKHNFTKKTRIIILRFVKYLPTVLCYVSLSLPLLHFFQFDKRKYYYQICIISKKNNVVLKNYWVNFTTKRVDFFSFKRRKKLKGVLMFNATPLQEKKFINFLTKKTHKKRFLFFPPHKWKKKNVQDLPAKIQKKNTKKIVDNKTFFVRQEAWWWFYE